MGTGKRAGGDGRRARKSLSVDGVVDALDWLAANEPRRSGVWADVGPSLRHRPAALLAKLVKLKATNVEYRTIWADVERALRALTDEVGR